MSHTQYRQRIYLLLFLLAGTLSVRAQAENMETLFDIHHLLAYLVAGFLMSVFIMLFINRLYYFRAKEADNHQRRLNAQLSAILDSSHTHTWTYDIERDLFTVVSSSEQAEQKYSPIEFSQLYDRDDFRELLNIIGDIIEGKLLTESLLVKSAMPKDAAEPQRFYDINVSVLRRNRRDRALMLLGIQRDITEDRAKEEQAHKLMLRYQTVFNSSQVDMLFYDTDGYLKDINEKACETFKVADRQLLLKHGVKFSDIPTYEGMDIMKIENTQFSSIVDVDKQKRENERVPDTKISGEFYYEANLAPVKNEEGETTGIVVAGRNITEMVESFHRQQEATSLLNKSTKDMETYIDNINYSMKISDVRFVDYDPDTHELKISSDLNKVQYKLQQLRAVTLIDQKERRKCKGLLLKMDKRHNKSLNATLPTILRDKDGRRVYLEFQMMPILDKTGYITHYFGICRNVTEMVYTEKMLQEETAKAQETEQLKSTFLQNMSYELRTPLNAVVGFAELYNAEHNPEDEPVFAEEIKTNTNVLLRLINDILFISRLDARMIEFDLQPNDFAILFDGWCYMGWSAMTQNPNMKTIVENPYNSLIVNIDQQHLEMVVQKLCTYAAYSSRQGSEGLVRAKYEYHHGELTITIEDNGQGLSPEARAKLFDRFSRNDNEGDQQSTGLDLPIVKELVEQMGGTIELQSESGKGTTFYISIPCEMINLEKKSEIII